MSSSFWSTYVNQYGWSIIPIQTRSKKPVLSTWKEFQARKPTTEEIAAWESKYPHNNVAVICGTVSGLVVLDVDSDDGYRWLKENGHAIPATPRTESSPGKGHFYFQHPGFSVKNMIRKVPGIDIKGDGGYVVAPPSMHPSGARYRWLPAFEPDKVKVAPCPAWLIDLMDKEDGEQKEPRGSEAPHGGNNGTVTLHNEDDDIDDQDWVTAYLRRGVSQGMRNVTAAKLAGHFLGVGNPRERVLEILELWNIRNDPPLSTKELLTAVDSIARSEAAKRLREQPHIRQDPEQNKSLSQDEQRQSLLGGVSDRLGVPVRHVVKVLGETPQYIVLIEDVEVTLTANHLMNQLSFRTKVMEATNKIPQKVKSADWEGMVQNMLVVAEIVEAGEESTVLGEMRGQIVEYLAKNHNLIFNIDEAEREMPDPDSPVIWKGELYINRNSYLKWINTYMMARPPSRNAVAQYFSRLGLEYMKLWVSKIKKQFRVWRVPQEFYLMATNQLQEGGDADAKIIDTPVSQEQ